jgi:NAD(P)H-hydrate repair Nnr-like enzyme with NAD(P)H-hydrate epimerase domain
MRVTIGNHQSRTPVSIRLQPKQQREVDAAAALGVSRSRLMRSAALAVARELQKGAQPSLRLHR